MEKSWWYKFYQAFKQEFRTDASCNVGLLSAFPAGTQSSAPVEDSYKAPFIQSALNCQKMFVKKNILSQLFCV